MRHSNEDETKCSRMSVVAAIPPTQLSGSFSDTLPRLNVSGEIGNLAPPNRIAIELLNEQGTGKKD
jgi:hypothetical protein